jgi:hypothetical protein
MLPLHHGCEGKIRAQASRLLFPDLPRMREFPVPWGLQSPASERNRRGAPVSSERHTGSDPASSPWQDDALPLS